MENRFNFRFTTDPFYLNIQDTIEKYGWMCIGVGSEEGSLPFIYTIGMKYYNRPDLLLLGGASGGFHQILNILAKKSKETQFKNNELVEIGGKFPPKIIDASSFVKQFYTIQAGQFYGTEDYSVQQVVFSDKSGKYPGDPDCEEPYASIPVFTLGEMKC